MNILKEVLKSEVKPALGCTEPIAVAYACSMACQAVKEYYRLETVDVLSIKAEINPGVVKNGLGVCIPNAKGRKGNAIAAALGAIGGQPLQGMAVLQGISDAHLNLADGLVKSGKVEILCNKALKSLYIKAEVITSVGIGNVVIQNGHTNIIYVGVDGQVIEEISSNQREDLVFNEELSKMKIADLVGAVSAMDEDDYRYIQEGIDMNLDVSKAGLSLNKVGDSLKRMLERPIFKNDVLMTAKILVSCATDARMAGMPLKVMSSGGSGNQGIVAILVPYHIGVNEGIDLKIIQRSIALSHLVNSYVKCFTGELAPICGCAIAAGLGASAAIVYQQQPNAEAIGRATDLVIANITGLLCDGAKGGCALKVVSSTDCAILSAYYALGGFKVESSDGIIGQTPEQTICNLGRVAQIGFGSMDDTVLDIMLKKM